MNFEEFILLAWMPVVLIIFALISPRRAVLLSLILGWLLLPVPFQHHAYIRFRGFPDMDKAMITSVSVLAAVCLFDLQRIGRFKPRTFDLPMLVWCLLPMASSINVGRGVYDGFSECVSHVIVWGIPYFVGRMYFTNPQAIKELAVAVLIGGLLYVPLCWYESWMSPRLHRDLYGYLPAPFIQHKRFGGYRPMTFMHSGLMVGIWMTTATLLAFWFWMSGALRRWQGFPMWLLFGVLLFTTLLCKATTAILLAATGIGFIIMARKLKMAWPVAALVFSIVVYLGVRSTNTWSGDELVDTAGGVINTSRAESLQFRLAHERLLADKALEKPLFGWASEFRVYNDEGEDMSVTDSLWIITFGRNGYFGLITLTVVLLFPTVVFLAKFPVRRWPDPPVFVGAAFAMLLPLYMVDNLFNAFPNPIYIMMLGSLTGLVATVKYLKPSAPRPSRTSPPLSAPASRLDQEHKANRNRVTRNRA